MGDAEGGPDSLTGIWQGRYAYRNGISVAFTATLIETATRLTGTVSEPSLPGAATLFATLLGGHSGGRVSFVKTYDKATGHHRPVSYDGTLSADRTAIAGTWRITRFGSGTFQMVRPKRTAATVARAVTERV